jgi:hypothetical protein
MLIPVDAKHLNWTDYAQPGAKMKGIHALWFTRRRFFAWFSARVVALQSAKCSLGGMLR